MDQDKSPRRVKKVTEDATHRTGSRRAAIKPHKRTTEGTVKQVVAEYTAKLNAARLSQTFWGETLTKNAAALRSNFGLAASDELFLLLDPSKSGRAGMLLSSSGVNLADGRGGTLAIPWKDFATTSVGYQRGMLVIGQSGISSNEGQALVSLLQQIQSKLS